MVTPLTCRAAHGCCPRHCTLSADRPSPCLALAGERCAGPQCRISASPEPESCHTGPRRGDACCVLPKSLPGSLSQAQGCDRDWTTREMPEGARCKSDSLADSSRDRTRTRGRCWSCQAPYRRDEGPKPLQCGLSHSPEGASQEGLTPRVFEATTLQLCP